MGPRRGMYHDMETLRRWARGDVSERELIFLLLAPATIFLLLMVVYPLGRTIHLSMHFMKLSLPQEGTPFVGLENFVKMFTDPRFFHSLRVLAVYGVGSVVFPLLIGLGMALVVHRVFPGRWVARAAVILPWAMPRSLSALTWSWILDGSYGLVNGTLMRLGMVAEPIQFLGSSDLAMASLIFTSTWKTASFMALILLAGLQSIPNQLYEQGRVDGANRLQAFRYITLPQLRSSILVALIFRTIVAVQVFDTPFALTKGGPGIATEPLSLYIHRVTLNHLDFGYGSALALFMIAITLVAAILYIRVLWEEE
ncbi:MAG: carbohydrate ABC transporter permease [Spirochaetaceae bacterium]